MNKDKLNALADFIENHPAIEFNMRDHDKCFIGFARLLFHWHDDDGVYNSTTFAREFNMTHDEARHLCLRCEWANPDETVEWCGGDADLLGITRQQAVAHLRMLAAFSPPVPRGWESV